MRHPGLSAGLLQSQQLLQGTIVSTLMRGLVAQVESEGFGIFNRVGLQIDGALGEPVALGHVVDQDALAARRRLELVGGQAMKKRPRALVSSERRSWRVSTISFGSIPSPGAAVHCSSRWAMAIRSSLVTSGPPKRSRSRSNLTSTGALGLYGMSAPGGGQDAVGRLIAGSLVLTGATCGAAGDEAGTSGAAGAPAGAEAEDCFCF